MNMDVKKNEVKEMAVMLDSRRDEAWKSMQKVLFEESSTTPLRVKRQARNSGIYSNSTQ